MKGGLCSYCMHHIIHGMGRIVSEARFRCPYCGWNVGDVRRVVSLGMLKPRNCNARAVMRAGQRRDLL